MKIINRTARTVVITTIVLTTGEFSAGTASASAFSPSFSAGRNGDPGRGACTVHRNATNPGERVNALIRGICHSDGNNWDADRVR